MTVQSSIQPLGSGAETSSYSRFESHGGTSDSIDRLDDMTTLIGSKKIRTGRSEWKFPEPG